MDVSIMANVPKEVVEKTIKTFGDMSVELTEDMVKDDVPLKCVGQRLEEVDPIDDSRLPSLDIRKYWQLGEHKMAKPEKTSRVWARDDYRAQTPAKSEVWTISLKP
jgi:hypothetical protein